MMYARSEDDKVYAVASDGTLMWCFRTREAIEGSPALANGVVYAACADGSLYALDARMGRLLWRTNPDGRIGPRSEAGTIA